MKQITVLLNQLAIDICMQEYGSASALYQLAFDNGFTTIPPTLQAGQKVWIDETKIVRKDIVDFYKSNNIKVVTGGTITNYSSNKIFDQTFDFSFQ